MHVDNEEQLFLTVQTLKFQGENEKRNRPRTSFKYKHLPNNLKHRMFIKQIITEQQLYDDEKSSQVTCYYFDDYIKYLYHNDKSRPASGMSTIFLHELINKFTENKDTKTNIPLYCLKNNNKSNKMEHQRKQTCKKSIKNHDEKNHGQVEGHESDIEDTKISFKKSGNRKSLTISRSQSPETIQVIRVDVVCNYRSNTSISDYADDKKENELQDKEPEQKKECFNIKNNSYAAKYQLTHTVKTIDQHLYGGSKVTLLCKTFKLSERSNNIFVKYKSPERKFPKQAFSKNVIPKHKTKK